MNRIVHFEIPAKDPNKVAGFYKNVFNWKIEKWDGPQDYWLVTTGEKTEPGINGGIFHPDTQMRDRVINTVGVDGLEGSVEKVKKNGGQIFGEIMDIPNMGRMAYCTDNEGTLFGMMQSTRPM